MSDLLSLNEWCRLHGKDPGNMRRMAAAGRLPASKIGNQWVIPADTEPPEDKRVKSGAYIGWRKPKEPETEP